jgi:hypothetical protein
MTAARIALGLPLTVTSQREAAQLTGSNALYTAAAATVLQSEDPALVTDVLVGRIGLLTAARQVKRRADLIAALRAAAPEDKAAAGRVLGAAMIFDTLVTPAL